MDDNKSTTGIVDRIESLEKEHETMRRTQDEMLRAIEGNQQILLALVTVLALLAIGVVWVYLLG